MEPFSRLSIHCTLQMVIMCPPFGVLLSCFHPLSSRPCHERLNHGFFPASFVLSTAVCVHCNISELFTLRAITYSLIVVSACVTRSVVIHPISPPAISSTATILPEISRPSFYSSSLYGSGSGIQALTNRSFARQVYSSIQLAKYQLPPVSLFPT